MTGKRTREVVKHLSYSDFDSAIKRVVSTTFISSRDGMCSLIRENFTEISSSKSYARSWIEKFLPEELQKSING